MMVQASVGYSDTTQVPYLAFVSDGTRGIVVDVNGEVPGSAEAVVDIGALFGPDGVDPFVVFDLYAAAYGCSISPPVDIPVGSGAAVEYMANQLMAAQGGVSPSRQQALDKVSRARSEMMLDSGLLHNDAAYDPEVGLDGTWSQGTYEEFLMHAEWQPYYYDPSREQELADKMASLVALDEVGEEIEVGLIPVQLPAEPLPPVEPATLPPVEFVATEPAVPEDEDEEDEEGDEEVKDAGAVLPSTRRPAAKKVAGTEQRPVFTEGTEEGS